MAAKRRPEKQIGRVIDLEAEHACGDGLGYNDEIGVLQPQQLVFDVATVD
jgi:hypothetical protein